MAAERDFEGTQESSWWTFGSFGRRARPAIAEDAEAAEALNEGAEKRELGWARAEYLLWRLKSANTPPLVTTGPFTDPLPGALSSLSTNVLFGGSPLDYRDRSGGRFAIGYWLDNEMQWGVSAEYFFLAGRSIDYRVASEGNPVLAVPFFNTNTNAPDSSLVTFPGVVNGRVQIDAPSFLHSAEANLNCVLWNSSRVHWEAIAGFRYVGLNEGLHMQQTSMVDLAPQFIGLVPFNGNTFTVNDSFDTRNHFYGGQVGMRTEFLYKRLSLSVLTKVALGSTYEVASIRGFTGIDTQPATAINAGLLALASNSGQFSRNIFAVVPELGVNLGFQLTDHARVSAGYNFLYWSSVLRPGDQIDTTINPNFVPTSNTFGAAGGPVRPAYVFHATDFFAHGVNFSLELRY